MHMLTKLTDTSNSTHFMSYILLCHCLSSIRQLLINNYNDNDDDNDIL